MNSSVMTCSAVKMVNAQSVVKGGDVDYIAQLIKIEAEKGNMAQHPAEEIEKIISNGDGIFAMKNEKIIGFIGLIHWIKYVEVICLIVLPKFRKQCIASDLTRHLISYYKEKYYGEKELIGFTNEISSKILLRCGFVEHAKDHFGSEVWEECHDCVDQKNFPHCHCRGMVYKF